MSEPVPGSVMPSAQTVSPRMIPGRYFCFCASVPKRVSHGDDMSVCTSTLKATPPERQRAISSPSTMLAMKSPPPPPYSVGTSRPRKPSCPRRRQNDRGICPAASHASTCGATSLSTKARSDLRSISCSAVNGECGMGRDYSVGIGAGRGDGRSGPRGARALELAKVGAPDLAADRLRQIGDELDFARILVRRGHALHVLLELG